MTEEKQIIADILFKLNKQPSKSTKTNPLHLTPSSPPPRYPTNSKSFLLSPQLSSKDPKVISLLNKKPSPTEPFTKFNSFITIQGATSTINTNCNSNTSNINKPKHFTHENIKQSIIDHTKSKKSENSQSQSPSRGFLHKRTSPNKTHRSHFKTFSSISYFKQATQEKFGKYDTQELTYKISKEYSKAECYDKSFLERMEFYTAKINLKENKINQLVNKSKPQLPEEQRIEAFNRLITDSNRRAEAKKRISKVNSNKLLLASDVLINLDISNNNNNNNNTNGMNRSMSQRNWNNIYKERFTSKYKDFSKLIKLKLYDKENNDKQQVNNKNENCKTIGNKNMNTINNTNNNNKGNNNVVRKQLCFTPNEDNKRKKKVIEIKIVKNCLSSKKGNNNKKGGIKGPGTCRVSTGGNNNGKNGGGVNEKKGGSGSGSNNIKTNKNKKGGKNNAFMSRTERYIKEFFHNQFKK